MGKRVETIAYVKQAAPLPSPAPSPAGPSPAGPSHFIDMGWGSCSTAAGETTPILFMDCRSSTPYSMKNPAKFPPWVKGTEPTSVCQELCAARSGCTGFTMGGWYSGSCKLHGRSKDELEAGAKVGSQDLMSLEWGQQNMCSRAFYVVQWGSSKCTQNCEVTKSDGKKGRDYRCYVKKAGPAPQKPDVSSLINDGQPCYHFHDEKTCIAHVDGRGPAKNTKPPAFDGIQPCRWCCGGGCSGGGNKCEPEAWTLNRPQYNGRSKNGLGEDSC